MDIDEYQKHALETAIYPAKGQNLSYPALGLTGEAGEVADKIKKIYRDQDGTLTEDNKIELAKELGDVLWYIAILAHELQVPLSGVAKDNLSKLQDRKNRNVLHGSGDNR